ncbi:DUF4258 domain-containing protein [Gangjinia marincola]|uniref:DUF4258 domain-containing protein n=1 Tax=Gangjinia marincola TaxID=578463 RepID=A0ABN1MDA0_9FLAO
MTLKQRFGFYLGGFGIGIIVLIFFLSGKKTRCDYFPNDRVLHNIRTKERSYSEAALQFIQRNELDTARVSTLLYTGSVDFSQSDTKLDSCKRYHITGELEENDYYLVVENCSVDATVLEVGKSKD